MIALEVSVNDEILCRAGKDDLTVLHTVLNAVGILNTNSSNNHLSLSVGGMHSGEDRNRHDKWISSLPLKVGDVVSVKVLEVDKTDPPSEVQFMTPDEYKKR